MIQWAIIVMVLAFAGAAVNIYLGTPMERLLHDVMLFLISLGMLFRIKYKVKKGDREKQQSE